MALLQSFAYLSKPFGIVIARGFKQDRAMATRYDKRAVNFLGATYLAAAVIWLN